MLAVLELGWTDRLSLNNLTVVILYLHRASVLSGMQMTASPLQEHFSRSPRPANLQCPLVQEFPRLQPITLVPNSFKNQSATLSQSVNMPVLMEFVVLCRLRMNGRFTLYGFSQLSHWQPKRDNSQLSSSPSDLFRVKIRVSVGIRVRAGVGVQVRISVTT